MNQHEFPSDEERRHHTYVSNKIPWYVCVIWLVFWGVAIGYAAIYLLPALRTELLNPP